MANANQGIISRITALFRNSKTEDRSKQATGPLGVTEEYSKHDRLAQRFKVDQDRLTILKEVNEMYHSDDRAKAIIDNTSEDATYGGFEVTVAEAEGGRTEEAQQILNDTRKLFGGLVGWAKKGLIEGDLFLQVVVADSDVVELIRMPASTMRRNSNDKDKFDDPLKAYAQVDPLSGAAYALEINLAQVDSWFAEWQVTHARWNHLGGRYGNSLFRSSRGSYKKAREGETDMAIRRKTRAGIKYVHELEDASEAELEAYKERNKDTLKNPFAAIADFFTNKKTKITAIQGDAKLDQIKDVEHHINTMFVSSPIPKSLVGYGESINRDVLDKQEAQYLRRLESVADWVNEQIIKPVLDLQLLLKGILPESVSYNIVWPDRSMDTFVDVIDGAVKIKSLGLPDRYVLQVLRKVITDLNIKAVLEEMESEKQTNTDKETDAIAKNLELMKAQMRGSDPKERKKAKEAIERIIRGVGDVAGDSEEEFIDRLKALRGVS